ncbi:hypothetical protein KCTC52924_01532 [Arenibacter antarcticus]|uniref:DUF5004 domain-containing protein n=1 Tax=Arenibacter antarcticus TaxID=2040469 RepID=A0ABW5VKY8_9FLAO|nr:DUF5004 domain-containing protein [Arenibacter sp. H213]MCM4166685.1 DUF5004 domain-containing protein [Arenibacter sp. H213]
MKLRSVLSGFGTLVLVLGFNSCDVSNDTEFVCQEDFTGALVENENVLVGKWELTAIVAEKEVDLTSDSESNPKTDIYVQYSECDRDANFVYTSDRGYTNSQGQSAENCTNKAKFSGTWKLNGNVLSFVNNCSSQNMTLEFNEDKSAYSFTGNYNITDANGQKILTDITFTYSKADSETEPVE